jgi:hypothetical protein
MFQVCTLIFERKKSPSNTTLFITPVFIPVCTSESSKSNFSYRLPAKQIKIRCVLDQSLILNLGNSFANVFSRFALSNLMFQSNFVLTDQVNHIRSLMCYKVSRQPSLFAFLIICRREKRE